MTAVTTFDGFGEDLVPFFEGLVADNSRAYWTEHRETYEAAVRRPMLALLTDLADEFGEGTMFRPYRDVRFSRDKSPYKTTVAGIVRRDGGSAYYVQLGTDGLMVGGGMHTMEPDQLGRFRRAVDDDVVGTGLQRLLDGLRAEGHELGGETLRTAPRGWRADHPRIELLRHKGLSAYRTWPEEDWLTTSRCADVVAACWREYTLLDQWLDAHVGPPQRSA